MRTLVVVDRLVFGVLAHRSEPPEPDKATNAGVYGTYEKK